MLKTIKDAFTNLFAFIKDSLASLKTRISKNFGKATSYFGSFFKGNTASAEDSSFSQNSNQEEITTPVINATEEAEQTLNTTLTEASQTLDQAKDNLEETIESPETIQRSGHSPSFTM